MGVSKGSGIAAAESATSAEDYYGQASEKDWEAGWDIPTVWGQGWGGDWSHALAEAEYNAQQMQDNFDPGNPGQSADDIGDQADDRGNGKKKEELGTPAVTLTAPTGSLQAGQWFNPLARQEYTAPAAQDWSGWMFGSPFGEQGGLLYQPWSAEYGQQYVPSNIWNWNPMEMSKATAFAPPIASTSILGDSASVANTVANTNNNNNTVVNTPIVNDGNQGDPLDTLLSPLDGARELTDLDIATALEAQYETTLDGQGMWDEGGPLGPEMQGGAEGWE